jgi:light-regulated signal transduction histidine kinase (bacteriophytochrome)
MAAITPLTEARPRDHLACEYLSALGAYVSGAGEAALTRAYELGRKAVSNGLSVLELAVMHHEALWRVLAQQKTDKEQDVVSAAAQFLTESLSHFEMTLRLDEALRKAKAAAEEANRELESFSYSVAHDLRAPLRSIDGFSQALLEECAGQLNADGQRYLQYVRESAQRMSQLIDDLLGLSRVSRGELNRSRVDLSLIARNVVERLRAREPSRRVEFVASPDVFARCDARLMAAALENLLGNAWKFTGNRPVAHIEFGVEHARRPAVYFVKDDGAGFDMAYAARLFGVFQRLHSTEEFEGTGVGLATVQRIIRRHGGRVWAEGIVDGGATFYFTLEESAAVQEA